MRRLYHRRTLKKYCFCLIFHSPQWSPHRLDDGGHPLTTSSSQLVSFGPLISGTLNVGFGCLSLSRAASYAGSLASPLRIYVCALSMTVFFCKAARSEYLFDQAEATCTPPVRLLSIPFSRPVQQTTERIGNRFFQVDFFEVLARSVDVMEHRA